MFPITAPRPARKCESVSGSHQSDAIPTGPAIRFCQPIGGELPWSGTNLIPRLAPSYRQPPSRQPWRATQPPTHSPRHFVNNNIKKPLHNFPLSAIMKQETAKANKGRPRRAATLLGPMQEPRPPTQQISAPSPFYQISIGYSSVKNGNVCLAFGGVGINCKPCAAFVVSAVPSKAHGGREEPTPKGRTVETERKIMWKENTR